MAIFRKLLTSALLAIACASYGFSTPLASHERHATRRSIDIGPGLTIEAFHPPSTFETFAAGIDHPLSKRGGPFSLKDASVAFAGSKLSKGAGSVSFRTGFSGDVAQHAFLTQTHDGIPFANAVANVAFNKDDKVVSFGSSLVNPKSIASSTPTISLSDAITIAENALNGKFNEHPATLEFFAKPDNTAVLTHVIQIENDATGAWFEAFVDAHSGDLVSVTDFVTKAAYLVVPMQEEILTQGFQTLTDPQDLLASPLGWHSNGTVNTTVTSGNNAIAFKANQNATTSQSAPGQFFFTQDPNSAPTTPNNLDAARVNAFYIVNTMHDLTYRYGFTEAAFNFQNNNFGKGGLGNDQVTISVQDAAGTNNADFSTPPDGQSGRMRMFLWTLTNPMRDGALENDIVTHENTHGVTNRMTGGGTGRCLQTTEAGGMGEGWSDAMANWNEKTSSAVDDFVLGQYVTNNTAGIRTHPYSTNAVINPLRYSDLKTRTEVHSIGEVWANMLYNVYANLVGVHGWSSQARTNPDGREGNIVFLHLFLDALALQPCNPTFLSARDAWIQADVNRFGGANACFIWKAFASRGLGTGAANHTDDTTVPPACVET
ncbi:Extracellular metalloproteinase mep [Psilocybe cubensis]|uniref:Extracellular metalloproteinase mep n=2 Tax=Psilocybe cubensis TaxID=181762 RepID=A0ACB8GPI8_PSICU|nr:Extracellular metalloproteinase mep [Psilocybe cubensis]KAH9477322.1 Extracellular metalloproteinase mep [Psilocybe cubensis]